MPRNIFVAAAIAGAAAACASAPQSTLSPWAASNPTWVKPFDPFPIEAGVYYVGTRGLSSFLITTDEGHFLLDGGMPESAPIIADNIRTLGFKLQDVRVLLNSHAHFDHSGGLAALKKLTGARLVASAADRPALEGGFYQGSEEDKSLAAPPVKVDQTIADGETLVLGTVTLKARLTPGHTPGCTTWTMTAGGRDILFFCSATVAANRLIDPPQYEGIVDDYRETFQKMRHWRPDILLANHPEFFGMEERRARQIGGDEDAFVDQAAFPALISRLEAAFEAELARQSAAAQPKE